MATFADSSTISHYAAAARGERVHVELPDGSRHWARPPAQDGTSTLIDDGRRVRITSASTDQFVPHSAALA